MSYLVLARKYRPATFEEVVGQEGVVRTLKNAIAMERVAHAYLFTGARGVGKTTVARLLAKALNCEQGPTATPDNTCSSCVEIARGISPDVFEIDGASNTGVDDVRQLRDNAQYMPARSRFKIYIIDEVHMLSTSAFNALLKTLEEPPAHVKFVFATTEPHKIPLTVLSRCQRFDFKRIPSALIQEHLARVLSQEGMPIDPAGLQIIARQAAGSIRDAMSLTDQVLAFGGEQIGVREVRDALGLADAAVYGTLVDAVIEKRADELLQTVECLFDEGHDLRKFLDGLLWHVHRLMIFSSVKAPEELIADLMPEEIERLAAQSGKADSLRWQQVFDVLARAAEELARSPFPRLVLEAALLRLSVIEPAVSIDELLARVESLAGRLGGGAPAAMPGGSSLAPSPSRGRAGSDPGRDAAPASTQPAPGVPDRRPGEPQWEKLVEMVGRHRPSLGSFLSHACPREISPGRVSFAFERNSFFADQVRSQRNLRELERLFSDYFQTRTEVHIEDLEERDAPSLAQSQREEEQKAEQAARRQALDHPMVKEAIRVFGAEVATVRTDRGDRR
ncbi:MAG: DNA polymerase III subunit gamma/tau [Deltaproteobacteria bacterium]|nr:DNA polymerase III subunit gamma/tau [Deltaproteobacteria bacterium]